ncbi:MAG TPA: MarR family transcriptional regulator [Lachnospiraceae bacterium]|nr:MarR family transcriptional regulator [Lachnospiraceae bacterium]
MNYESLAQEYMELLHQLRRWDAKEHITASVHGERFILFYIYKKGGSVIPSDISKEMGITSARVAAALNSLEGKGLISRRIDGEDRRRILVDLTEDGKRKICRQHRKVMGAIINMLQYLGEDDAKELIRIMKKLLSMKRQNRQE